MALINKECFKFDKMKDGYKVTFTSPAGKLCCAAFIQDPDYIIPVLNEDVPRYKDLWALKQAVVFCSKKNKLIP